MYHHTVEELQQYNYHTVIKYQYLFSNNHSFSGDEQKKIIIVRPTTDNYHRSYSAATVRTFLDVEEGANDYSLPLAASGTRGGAKIGYAENGKNYPVELSSEKMYVNVPWTDTVYTLLAATASVRGGVKTGTASSTGLQMSGDTIELAASGSFVLDALSVNTINANKITANTITATQMAADSITAGQLAISNAASGSAGIYFSTTAIEIRDSSNNLRVKIGLL